MRLLLFSIEHLFSCGGSQLLGGYCVVAVRSRCGRDVVTMWWCYWSDAPCTRHAPFGDVQDANEMRTVEDAKWNENYVGISGRMIERQK